MYTKTKLDYLKLLYRSFGIPSFVLINLIIILYTAIVYMLIAEIGIFGPDIEPAVDANFEHYKNIFLLIFNDFDLGFNL